MAQVKGQTKEKEPTTSVSEVYFQVVDDVIESVREDFQSEGVDESVLAELRQLWELKMMQTGAIDTTPLRDTNVPVSGKHNSAPMHDLNVPYEGTDEYQTPTMDMLFPPTPQTMTPQVATPQAMTPIPMTPVPMTPIPTTPQAQQVDPTTLHMAIPAPPVTSGGEPVMYQYIAPGPAPTEEGVTFETEQDVKQGKGAPWMNNKARGVDVNIDMNASYEERPFEEGPLTGQDPVTKDFFTLSTGKRKREDPPGALLGDSNIPQQDGAGDISSDREGGEGDSLSHQKGIHHDGECSEKDSTGVLTNTAHHVERPDLMLPSMRLASVVPRSGSSQILQCDGIDDDYDGVAEEDYNDAGYDDAQTRGDLGTRLSAGDTGDGLSDGEPPLNEDDDNDQGEEDDEPQTDHLVLAQFEKVTRSKNKWKCTLKDGVMHLNKKDILFVRANGEFVF